MRAATLFCLIGAALAGPVPSILQERQGSNAITTGLDNIGKAIDATQSVVTSWDGKGATFDTIVNKISQVSDALKDATAKTKAAPTLGLIEATAVVPPATTLDGKLGTLMNSVVSNKAKIATAGKTAQVKSILTEERTNAKAFVDAILSKMPALAGPVAQPITQGFMTKLDGALAQF